MTDTKTEHTVVATAGTIPAVFLSVIPQKETSMSKMWPFLTGVLVGATGIVVAACVVDTMAKNKEEPLSEEVIPDSEPTVSSAPKANGEQVAYPEG